MLTQYLIMQVIGNVLKDPSILDREDQYSITEEDFVEEFHRIVFGSIQKIYELGATKIHLREHIRLFIYKTKV